MEALSDEKKLSVLRRAFRKLKREVGALEDERDYAISERSKVEKVKDGTFAGEREDFG
jgi:hypothetical protein